MGKTLWLLTRIWLVMAAAMMLSFGLVEYGRAVGNADLVAALLGIPFLVLVVPVLVGFSFLLIAWCVYPFVKLLRVEPKRTKVEVIRPVNPPTAERPKYTITGRRL